MTTPPAVSVVVPVWNGERSLRAAMSSVLSGTWEDLELIVVDDGSTDRSREVASSIPDPRVRVLSTARAGVCRARNHGAAAATGELLAFLDADDEVDARWLEVLVALLEPGVGLATCGYRGSGDADSSLEGGPYYLAGTWATRRPIFDAVGGYEPDLQYGENYELVYRIRARIQLDGKTMASTGDRLLTYHKTTKPLTAAGARARLRAAEIMLERHRDQLGPREQANFHRISGVNHLRLGDGRRGARELRRAARLSGRPADALRALAALIPPIARRAWSPPDGL